MIVIDHLSALSKHGSGWRLHGLSGVGIVLGGLWVVLKLEWSPRTPPIESCRDRSSFHFLQAYHHLVLFLSLCSGFFQLHLHLSLFFGLCNSFFQPHLHLSFLLSLYSSFFQPHLHLSFLLSLYSCFFLGFGNRCFACFYSAFRVFCEL